MLCLFANRVIQRHPFIIFVYMLSFFLFLFLSEIYHLHATLIFQKVPRCTLTNLHNISIVHTLSFHEFMSPIKSMLDINQRCIVHSTFNVFYCKLSFKKQTSNAFYFWWQSKRVSATTKFSHKPFSWDR